MRALSYDELKGPEGIKLGVLPEPETGPNDVLVRVKAFSLNHLDLWVMSGAYPVKPRMPHIFASDCSGTVERVGAAVRHVKPGDGVVVHPGLSCGRCALCLSGRDNECRDFSLLGVVTPGVSAEFAKVPASNVFPKPDGLSFEEAAGIGITYVTAWTSLVLRAGIRQGDTVLILGGGGGAGTALIQVAKLFNAAVITTVGHGWKVEKAKALGADHVIDHTKEDFLAAVKAITGGRLADIVTDHVGAATFGRSIAAARKGGQIVIFGATTGDEAPLSLRQVFGKGVTIHGVYTGPRAAMAACLRLFPHRLRTVVDSVFEFEDARKAYEKMLSRQFFGKIVVNIRD